MDMRDVKEFLRDSLGYIIVIAIVFIVFMFILSIQQVYGESMTPNYKDKDVLILSKISYIIGDPKKGDVVALSIDSGDLYVKRVIAVPGDTIYAKNNMVFVNNNKISEEYLPQGTITEDFTFESICNKDDCDKGVLPENYYVVMGDNRKDSFDSRYTSFGIVPKDHFLGKVVFRIWPLNSIGFAK